MILNLPTREELEQKSIKNRTNTLFGLRQQVLREAANEWGRDEVFALRNRIANLFKTEGGERLQKFTDLLESLESPDDLSPHALETKRPQTKHESAEITWPGKGYYVVGDELVGNRERQMRVKLGGKKKAGSPRQINNLKQLFHTNERNILGKMQSWIDERPYFINTELTPEIVKILSFVLISRPDMRIYIIEWDGDTPSFKPFQTTALVKTSDEFTPEVQQLSIKLLKIINKTPIAGEYYHGRISNIYEFGFFVEITPDNEGFVHFTEASDQRIIWEDIRKHFKEDDFITVKVLNIDRQGHIRLSVKEALDGSNEPAIPPKLAKAMLSNEAGLGIEELGIGDTMELDEIDV